MSRLLQMQILRQKKLQQSKHFHILLRQIDRYKKKQNQICKQLRLVFQKEKQDSYNQQRNSMIESYSHKLSLILYIYFIGIELIFSQNHPFRNQNLRTNKNQI
ncbi:hypothetical protein TTHERM_000294699 (macronuclear) [Tetrahymena thermophila SB210]|uniref:Uncharacterized protein n=1 Tax=Tetrahymena thermophila (strain SB210) TaxID=312017 RepID=W7XJ18_TETTS|nr:hypothetical protein TTHERM_000294699 [Tetrahymena thermophila SB210]EWS75126.1 hypothetical protein TTHERM_000294699 [Tetrahymena thermophila SB210]|eukprot:XP_012652364.1 hypothetical protein TTHERM_000294699 [Tetrahymena thermophila SB210]